MQLSAKGAVRTVPKNSDIREKLMIAAVIRNDKQLENKLKNNENLFSLGAKYHLSCYSTYTAKEKLDKIKNDASSVKNVNSDSTYSIIAKEYLDANKTLLETGECTYQIFVSFLNKE